MATDPTRYRWLLWGILAGSFLLVSLHRLSTAVLAEPLMAGFRTTGTELGTIHAVFFVVYAILQLPTGVIVDRYGPRRIAAAGTVVMSLGAIGFALAGSFTGAVLTRAVVGLGAAVIYVAVLRFGANWYRADEFATFNGLTVAIAGLGGIVATVPLAVAVEWFGWRVTVIALGIVGAAVGVLIHRTVRDSPAAAGFEPLEGVPEAGTATFRTIRANIGTVCRDPKLWLVGLPLFVGMGVNFTILGLWGIPYVVQTYGLTVPQASVYTMIGSIGFMLGPPAVGWLSDHVGDRRRLFLGGAVVFAGCLAVFVLEPAPHLAVVGILFFVMAFLLGTFALSYPVVKEAHPTDASGVATGAVNTFGFLGAAAFPTLLGAALDAFWVGETIGGVRVYTTVGYRVAFGVAFLGACLAVLSAVLLLRTGADGTDG